MSRLLTFSEGGGGGQYQVLPPYERLCTSGVVRQGGKDGAAADVVLILSGNGRFALPLNVHSRSIHRRRPRP